jgi:hypothetical protein
MHDKPAQQQPEEITINADVAFGVLMIVYIRGMPESENGSWPSCTATLQD